VYGYIIHFVIFNEEAPSRATCVMVQVLLFAARTTQNRDSTEQMVASDGGWVRFGTQTPRYRQGDECGENRTVLHMTWDHDAMGKARSTYGIYRNARIRWVGGYEGEMMK
jgi:hypothetical protein